MKVAQSNPTLCDPMDYIVHGILQARILEWVAFLFFRRSSQPRDRTQVSCIAGRFFTSWATREALANKDPSNLSYGFSSSHVRMWELDHKEGWAPKNWCFQIVVLEKTLESPLDSKESKSVNPKGNQTWIFIERTDTEAPILWPPDVKNWFIGKDPVLM